MEEELLEDSVFEIYEKKQAWCDFSHGEQPKAGQWAVTELSKGQRDRKAKWTVVQDGVVERQRGHTVQSLAIWSLDFIVVRGCEENS